MNAILIIEYVGPNKRALNFLSNVLPDLRVTCLAASSMLQVFAVQFSDHLKYYEVLQLVRDDIGQDLKQAYWFDSPQMSFHVGGKSVGRWIEPYSNPEILQPPNS